MFKNWKPSKSFEKNSEDQPLTSGGSRRSVDREITSTMPAIVIPRCPSCNNRGATRSGIPYVIWWCLDSGSGRHILNNLLKFESIVKTPHQLLLVDGSTLDTAVRGTVNIVVLESKECHYMTLKGVVYAPHAPMNLLSVSLLMEQGYTFIFEENKAVIKDKDGSVFATAKKYMNLYFIKDVEGIEKEEEPEILIHRPKSDDNSQTRSYHSFQHSRDLSPKPRSYHSLQHWRDHSPERRSNRSLQHWRDLSPDHRINHRVQHRRDLSPELRYYQRVEYWRDSSTKLKNDPSPKHWRDLSPAPSIDFSHQFRRNLSPQHKSDRVLKLWRDLSPLPRSDPSLQQWRDSTERRCDHRVQHWRDNTRLRSDPSLQQWRDFSSEPRFDDRVQYWRDLSPQRRSDHRVQYRKDISPQRRSDRGTLHCRDISPRDNLQSTPFKKIEKPKGKRKRRKNQKCGVM